MSNALPVISVCIPTYNGRDHLAECIRSIRSQNFTDFEVVICDDRSSDGTLDCARQLAEGDERFRFIANPRRLGIAANWNNCVQEARGEWIKFVFQDDTIAPSCLETLLAACLRYGKPLGFCERDFIFEAGTSGTLRDFYLGHKQKLFTDYHASALINPEQVIRIAANDPHHNLVGEPTVTLIRKSLFREIGGFDEALIQLCDMEFWCRALIRYGAAFVPKSLAAFRVHAKATTALNNRERAYRGRVLDSLLIWYRIAFTRQFKPMRDAKVSGKSALWFRTECACYAAKAWKNARWPSDKVKGHSSGSLLAEWNNVKALCPGLQFLVGPGLVIAIGRELIMKIHGSGRGKVDSNRSLEGLERVSSWHYPPFFWRILPSPVKDALRDLRMRIIAPYVMRRLPRDRQFEQSVEDALASASLSIIVPVHDAPEVTKRCLMSLQQYAPMAEIILVDDASKLEETKSVLEGFASRNSWTLIRHEEALGHSAACGAGARLATQPYLCLLNSDTVVTPWCWRPIVQAFEENPEIGAAGPSTSNGGYQTLPLANFARHYMNDSQICEYARRLLTESSNSVLTDLQWAAGFALFIRRGLWNLLGGFDQNIPDYYNDVELCTHVLRAGYRVVWVRNSYIHHLGGACYQRVLGSESIYARIQVAKDYARQKYNSFNL